MLPANMPSLIKVMELRFLTNFYHLYSCETTIWKLDDLGGLLESGLNLTSGLTKH